MGATSVPRRDSGEGVVLMTLSLLMHFVVLRCLGRRASSAVPLTCRTLHPHFRAVFSPPPPLFTRRRLSLAVTPSLPQPYRRELQVSVAVRFSTGPAIAFPPCRGSTDLLPAFTLDLPIFGSILFITNVCCIILVGVFCRQGGW